MKIYIAGPITDLDPAVAYEAFLKAENAICHAGHVPLNPMKLVDQTSGRLYNEYLLDALAVMMLQADAVYLMDNWTDSKGAQVENAICAILGIRRFNALDEIPKNEEV